MKFKQLQRLAKWLHAGRMANRYHRRRSFGDAHFVLRGERLEERLVLSGSGFELPDVALIAEGESNGSQLFPDIEGSFEVGHEPFSIATGDFNGDGVADIATANLESDDVSVLLSNDDGTFQPAIQLAVGRGPIYVVAADFDANGVTDLATANADSQDISILLSTGNGTFQSQQSFDAAVSYDFVPRVGMTTGDYDGDGVVDITVLAGVRFFGAEQLTTLLGNGDGTFQPELRYGIFGTSSRIESITTGDFNSDGLSDVAMANARSDEVLVAVARTDRTPLAPRVFEPTLSFKVGGEPDGITTGDYNGDGVLDLVTVNADTGGSALLSDSRDLSLLLGNGDGTFRDEQRFGAGNAGAPLTSADFNGDGVMDLAGRIVIPRSVAEGEKSGLRILLGNNDGTFQPPRTFLLESYISIVTGDFNSDGVTDIATPTGARFHVPIGVVIVVGSGGTSGEEEIEMDAVSVVLGNGDGTFPVLQLYSGVEGLFVVGGFNDDGAADLVSYYRNENTGDRELFVSLSNRDRTFQDPVPVAASSQLPFVADVNRDGAMDFITPEGFLFGSGDGPFQVVGARAWLQDSLGDYNGDDFPDQISIGSGKYINSVSFGNSSGGFVAQRHGHTLPDGASAYGAFPFEPYRVISRDFNGDGLADLLGIGPGGVAVLVADIYDHEEFHNHDFFTHSSALRFIPSANISNSIVVTGDFNSVVTGDFNNDGKFDLALSDNSSDDVSIVLGNGDGTFQELVRLSEVGNAQLAVDFDGDGNTDLLTGTDTYMSILLANGDGTFRETQQFSSKIPRYESAIDFNGDGMIDLAYYGNSGSMMVLFGQGRTPSRDTKADLAGVELALQSDAQFGWGEEVGLSFELQNLAVNTASLETTVAFYLSNDETITTNDVLLTGLVGDQFLIPALSPGGSTTLQVLAGELRMPEQPPEGFDSAGVFYIGAIIDPENEVSESDKTNNANLGEGIDLVEIGAGRFVQILTHGFNPNPFDFAGFRAPWKTTYRIAITGIAKDTVLKGLSNQYVSKWDSSSGWLPAVLSKTAEFVFKKNGNRIGEILAKTAYELSLALAHRLAEQAARKIVADVIAEGIYLGDDKTGVSIHLIGHSRGAAVNARVSELLTSLGYTVDQYTSLDGFSTDWPWFANAFGDIAIEGLAVADKLVNYRVEDGLLMAVFGRPSSPLVDELLSPLDWRAPVRNSFDENTIIIGTPESGPSKHVNITQLYFESNERTAPDKYILNSPLGRALSESAQGTAPNNFIPNNPLGRTLVGEAESQSLSTLENATGVTTASSRNTRFRDFNDGSFEELGQLWIDGQDLIAQTQTDDPFLQSWLASLNDRQGLIETVWNVTGDVELLINDPAPNVTMQLTQTTDTSLGQYVVLDKRSYDLQFDVSVESAGAGDLLEVVFGDTVLTSIDLTQASSNGSHTLSLAGLETQAADLTFRIAGPSDAPAVVQLDNLRILTELAIDSLIATPESVDSTETILLEADDISDPNVVLASVAFYRESNSILELQTGAGGDELIRVDVDGGDGWTASFSTISLATRDHTVYAQASDTLGGVGEVAVASVAVEAREKPWQNSINSLDVNNDDSVSPIDVLLVVNKLNAEGAQVLPVILTDDALPPPFVDSNGDGSVSPIDALLVINFLNGSGGNSEGEFVLSSFDISLVDTPHDLIVTVTPDPDDIASDLQASAVPPVAAVVAREATQHKPLLRIDGLDSDTDDNDLVAAIDAFFGDFDNS
jgi:FG-GAP-like repeat/Dockerin type I domain/CARDB